MAKPTTRNELKEYCLRKLGKPVITINIDDTQADDALDDAIDFVSDYHYAFKEEAYIAYEVTQTDIDNQYIELGEEVTDVLHITNFVNNTEASDSLFSIKYQLRLHDLYDITSTTMQYYYIARQYMALLDDILNPEISYTYNEFTGRLNLNLNWSDEFSAGNYLLIKIYRKIDMDTYTRLWGQRVLRDVATEMMRLRWGDNLSKFGALQLPGGVTLEGPVIVQEARDRLRLLQEEFQTQFSEPTDFLVE